MQRLYSRTCRVLYVTGRMENKVPRTPEINKLFEKDLTNDTRPVFPIIL